MEWFRQLGRAIRNLARLAREQPIWAITALTLSPLALIRHLFRTAILFLIVGIVLAGGMQFVLARSEEHTSELQSLMRISYAVFCLKKKNCNAPRSQSKAHQIQPLINLLFQKISRLIAYTKPQNVPILV